MFALLPTYKEALQISPLFKLWQFENIPRRLYAGNGSVHINPRGQKIRSKSFLNRSNQFHIWIVYIQLFLITTQVHHCKVTVEGSHNCDMRMFSLCDSGSFSGADHTKGAEWPLTFVLCSPVLIFSEFHCSLEFSTRGRTREGEAGFTRSSEKKFESEKGSINELKSSSAVSALSLSLHAFSLSGTE